MFRSENSLATSLTISSSEEEAVLQRAWWPWPVTKVMIVILDQVFVRHLVMIVIDMLLTCSCEEALLKDIIIISTQMIT